MPHLWRRTRAVVELTRRSVSVEAPLRHFWKVKDDKKERLPWDMTVTTSWIWATR